MKTESEFEQVVKSIVIEHDLSDNFEVNGEGVYDFNRNKLTYQVADEDSCREVSENEDGVFMNMDGTECINFEYENRTYYFVKQ